MREPLAATSRPRAAGGPRMLARALASGDEAAAPGAAPGGIATGPAAAFGACGVAGIMGAGPRAPVLDGSLRSVAGAFVPGCTCACGPGLSDADFCFGTPLAGGASPCTRAGRGG